MEIKSKFDKGDVVVAFCGAEEKLHSYLIKDIVGYDPETNEFKYECLRINNTVKVYSRELKYNDLMNKKDPRISLNFYDHELYSDPFDYIRDMVKKIADEIPDFDKDKRFISDYKLGIVNNTDTFKQAISKDIE